MNIQADHLIKRIMKIAIIKYNAGNIMSVNYALKRIGYNAVVTDDDQFIRNADRVIFPGVGEAATTMNYLKEKGIDELIRELQQPVLGICLGLQLLCIHSEEGDTPCIGVFDTKIKHFAPMNKIPHMGWNRIFGLKSNLFKGIPENSYVYFVHSYYAEMSDDAIAKCDYITDFSAALQRENYYATQFHPEKSGTIGQKILKNFIEN